MKRFVPAIALTVTATATGAVALSPDCKAIAGTLTGLPCCYQANGVGYSSTYGADGKCKVPSLPWYKCLIEGAIGLA